MKRTEVVYKAFERLGVHMATTTPIPGNLTENTETLLKRVYGIVCISYLVIGISDNLAIDLSRFNHLSL